MWFEEVYRFVDISNEIDFTSNTSGYTKITKSNLLLSVGTFSASCAFTDLTLSPGHKANGPPKNEKIDELKTKYFYEDFIN